MKANHINIPSEEACRRIISDMGMLDNIVAHCKQVCNVSLFLADHLGICGLNRELILAAAFLHDITKTRSLHTNENHAETGAQLLKDLGYPEVADIIGQHVRLNHYDFVSGTPTDAQIVNYSDKRVLHDKIVPLNDRMGYILEKYGKTRERKQIIRILWEKTQQLEDRLFAGLPFSPDDIIKLIDSGSATPR
ncbi:MAG: HDIG domain-containing metalloprotein [Pseudomonadota bacterium]